MRLLLLMTTIGLGLALPLGAQGSRQAVGLLVKGDVFLDAFEMGNESLRSITTVGKPLHHIGDGADPKLTLSYWMNMNGRDTSYSLILNGSRLDSLLPYPMEGISLTISSAISNIHGTPFTSNPTSGKGIEHIWFKVPVSQLRDIAAGKATSFQFIGKARLGVYTIDDSGVSLLRRFLGMAEQF